MLPARTRRHRALRHHRGAAAGQGARHARVGAGARHRRQRHRHHRHQADRGRRLLRRHLGLAAQTGHEPRRPAQDQREGDDRRRQCNQKACAGRFRDRGDQSAGRDGDAAQARDRLCEKSNRGAGRRARLGALPDLPRVGARRVDRERLRDGAGRARRRHGADSELHDGRRTADRTAASRRSGSRKSRSARAAAAARSSS